VIEFAAHRAEARLNIAKTFAISELSETHRQKLLPTRETFLLIIAVITGYTLLELVPRKVLHELREDSLANVHPSLSAIAAEVQDALKLFAGLKKFKSKNLETSVNYHAPIALARIENSCPGQ